MSMKSWVRSLVMAGCVSGIALGPVAEAEAALSAYLTVKGEKQGQIKGGVLQKGRESSIAVIAINHEVVSPRDPASGLPTGKRTHKPLVITKELDKSSPLLYRALVTNENLPQWDLKVFLPGAKGVETLAYTVKLTNASVASIRMLVGEDGKLVQEVSFTYQKIEWTWNDGGITAMDDWQAPVVKK